MTFRKITLDDDPDKIELNTPAGRVPSPLSPEDASSHPHRDGGLVVASHPTESEGATHALICQPDGRWAFFYFPDLYLATYRRESGSSPHAAPRCSGVSPCASMRLALERGWTIWFVPRGAGSMNITENTPRVLAGSPEPVINVGMAANKFYHNEQVVAYHHDGMTYVLVNPLVRQKEERVAGFVPLEILVRASSSQNQDAVVFSNSSAGQSMIAALNAGREVFLFDDLAEMIHTLR